MVQIEIIGNLGADVREVDYNGSKFYSFSVCDNRKVNGKEVAQWFTCNLNRQSEVLQYPCEGPTGIRQRVTRLRYLRLICLSLQDGESGHLCERNTAGRQCPEA